MGNCGSNSNNINKTYIIEGVEVSGGTSNDCCISGFTYDGINSLTLTTSGGTNYSVDINNLSATTISANTLEVTNENWTIELVDAQEVDFYAPYNLQINSIQNILNTPTISLFDDDVSYTLGSTISSGSKITVSADTSSVVTLKVTK